MLRANRLMPTLGASVQAIETLLPERRLLLASSMPYGPCTANCIRTNRRCYCYLASYASAAIQLQIVLGSKFRFAQQFDLPKRWGRITSCTLLNASHCAMYSVPVRLPSLYAELPIPVGRQTG